MVISFITKIEFYFYIPVFYFLCVLPVVQYQEADNSSGFFGLQWDQGQQCNDNMTEERAQVPRLHAPHKTLPRPVQEDRFKLGIVCLVGYVSDLTSVCSLTGSRAEGSPLCIGGPCGASSSSSP